MPSESLSRPSDCEYVVRWQRAGLSPRQKMVQSREAADRLALRLQGRMAEVHPDRDPDAYACCDGAWDGCGGETHRERWEHAGSHIPPLVRLAIESRPVGDWERVSSVQPAPYPLRPTRSEFIAVGVGAGLNHPALDDLPF